MKEQIGKRSQLCRLVRFFAKHTSITSPQPFLAYMEREANQLDDSIVHTIMLQFNACDIPFDTPLRLLCEYIITFMRVSQAIIQHFLLVM